jgi:DNA-binding IclR family transcriptional regulator
LGSVEKANVRAARDGDVEREDGKAAPLERYFSLLETLSAFPDGLTLTELSTVLMLPKPTASRLLAGLRKADLVRLSDDTRTAYVIGDRMRRMMHLTADGAWVEHATRAALKRLAVATGETCYVARLDGIVIRSSVTESPDTPWRGFVLPGKLLQPNATASGKAIMAFQPQEIRDRALAEVSAVTEKTRIDRAAIELDYEAIRARGYATCLGEVDLALGAVAVPIRIADLGVRYSLGIVGPLARMEQLINQRIYEQMARIGRSIGFSLARAEPIS